MGRAVLMLLLVGGCSLVAVKSPANVGADKCTTSYGFPVLDTLVVAAATALVVNGISASDCGGGEGDHNFCAEKKGMQLGLIVGIPYALSAGVGYTKVARCNAARRERAIATR